jgi:RNA polymerase sigma-70 factor (ECF subfamily)
MPDCQVPDNIKEVERMMEEHGARLLRLCFLRLQDAQLAEDALQETFVKAWKAYPSFRHDSSEITWLTAIAINCCRSIKRKTWYRLVDLKTPLEKLPEPSVPFEPYDDTVTRAVMALPSRDQEVILMHYYQGLPVKDIAAILSMPLSTVTSRLMRARKKLKQSLERWYQDA